MRAVHILTRIPGLGASVQQLMPAVTVVDHSASVEEESMKPLEQFAGLAEAEVLLADPDLAAQVINKLPKLQWLQCTWAGVDRIMDSVAERPAARITRFGGAFGPAMAEYVIGQIIARERNFELMREQQKKVYWWQAPFRSYRLLSTLSIGILGTGDIGKEIARICKLFGMKVWAMVRTIPTERKEYIDEYRTNDGLAEILSACDYICSVLPNTVETRGLLNGTLLKNCMPKKAVFINVGRGSVICTDDLLTALKEGWIAAAILDVFEREPLPGDCELWRLPNVVLTPHVASMSMSWQVSDVFANNYERFTADEPLRYLVDWEKKY
ncbi:PREDICTED: glyoxylate/hydroxypyruvate reductase A-like [Priapulus caudatus]|uniref:Glyoxylate/hydroxypyruvate reductase A-like n=1 Tax=Priapulus caudatus TaxID=37621 RepID=A0ABM1EBA5_PRICU|nr:PREDICTED: glyoxylate/hydroxypyruvate reductase A-like [Priapulus caudatus]